MILFGTIAFLSPWLLLGLLVLPILWWLLRATPPAPQNIRFPGVRILLGLDDQEKTPDKTPWWLLLLRLLAVAAAILAFARPVLNPEVRTTGSGPLLVLLDGGWASAHDWPLRLTHAENALDQAARDGRPTALINLGEGAPPELVFGDAEAALERIRLAVPEPLYPDRAGFAALVAETDGPFETIWLHNGIGDAAPLAAALAAHGPVSLRGTGRVADALRPAMIEDDILTITAIGVPGPARTISVEAIGPDPSGIERVLAHSETDFESGSGEATARFDIPVELRNRITRFRLAHMQSAGAVSLGDDGLRRRKVGIISGAVEAEAQQFTSSAYFLEKALVARNEVVKAPLEDLLPTQPDMIILADIGRLSPGEEATLTDWVDEGGLLLRFAGPRLAAASREREVDALLPVRLRAGGRSVGGAMSWGAPRQLRPFDKESPFFGLTPPGDIDVTTQVMAQPDVDLPKKVYAALEDGTPLVTGDRLGAGRVVLVHVTANSSWSALPLSGLFVQMLDRLAQLSGNRLGDAGAVIGRDWRAERVLGGFGRLADAEGGAPIAGEALAADQRDRAIRPGLYSSGNQRIAVNLMTETSTITAMSRPAGVTWSQIGTSNESPLQAPLLILALILLAIDVLATLWVTGRLRPAVAAVMVLGAIGAITPGPAGANEVAAYAANNTVLAYVETGDASVDTTSEAGLRGLSAVLTERTAIEPVSPVGVDLENDDISLYPFLYWPISALQTAPSDAAYTRLNAFLRSGGMILFDTRDANLSDGQSTPNGQILQRIAAPLDIPPLERVAEDHVLTRTFYLLTDFPGRWNSRNIWAEAALDISQIDGQPFRNLNDGVTPVIIGGNDWAAAWAVDSNGNFMFPVGSRSAGMRQREMAYRFGINLVMHVMTGNYKSDQVHVPALLDRLGQ